MCECDSKKHIILRLMEPKKMLSHLYIKEGTRALNNSVEAALHKKKHKRLLIETEELARQYSVYDFVELKEYHRPQYYIAKETLRSYGKKSQDETLEIDRRSQTLKDIDNFRILEEKIVGKQVFQWKMGSENIREKIIREQTKKLFSCNDIKKFQEQNHQHLASIKNNQYQEIGPNLKRMDHKFIMLKSHFESYFESKELIDSLRPKNQNVQQISIANHDQVDKKVDILIEGVLESLFTRLITAIKFNDFLLKQKLLKKWDASILMHEEGEYVGKKIKGKLLYSVEEEIVKFRSKIYSSDFSREYFLRQKRYGIHKNNFQKGSNLLQYNKQQKNKNDYQQLKKKSIQNNRASVNFNTYHDEDFEDRPKSKSQFIPYHHKKQTSWINSEAKPIKIRNIDRMRDRPASKEKGEPISNKLRQFSNKYKKPSPLNTDNLGQFAYKSKKKVLFRRLENDQRKQNNKFKLVKYPIKIDVLQIYSRNLSTICYHIYDISVKDLSLKFIQDRIKYKQNRVKIEFPNRYSAIEEEKVIKCMQILNCLGAEVTCEQQSCYTNWNQIDEIDVMVVSWILGQPVSHIVYCYTQFFTNNLTKK